MIKYWTYLIIHMNFMLVNKKTVLNENRLAGTESDASVIPNRQQEPKNTTSKKAW